MSHHPSALRNREPIVAKLLTLLDTQSKQRALEIASGTGCHLELFAKQLPTFQWQPSEYVPPDDGEEYRTEEQLAKLGKIGDRKELGELEVIDSFGTNVFSNVLPAVALDASQPVASWPAEVYASGVPSFDLVFISNMFHITPWECTVGVISGAGVVLKPGGRLISYGPYKIKGKFTTESNAAFDQTLKRRNPRWGYRDVEDLKSLAEKSGLKLLAVHEMPVNNFMLEFCKVGVKNPPDPAKVAASGAAPETAESKPAVLAESSTAKASTTGNATTEST